MTEDNLIPEEIEELRLLREFWDLFWNGPGSIQLPSGHFGYAPDEMQDLDDAAYAVDRHYNRHRYFPDSKF